YSEMPVTFELVYQLLNNTGYGNNQSHNYSRSDSYVFYHEQLNTKKVYRVTCELASPQFLNKRFYNIECNNSDEQQQVFSMRHWEDLKCHLKQFLIRYLTPTYYNLHDNTMRDDHDADQLPTFQGVEENYTQGREDNSGVLSQ